MPSIRQAIWQPVNLAAYQRVQVGFIRMRNRPQTSRLALTPTRSVTHVAAGVLRRKCHCLGLDCRRNRGVLAGAEAGAQGDIAVKGESLTSIPAPFMHLIVCGAQAANNSWSDRPLQHCPSLHRTREPGQHFGGRFRQPATRLPALSTATRATPFLGKSGRLALWSSRGPTPTPGVTHVDPRNLESPQQHGTRVDARGGRGRN